MPPQLALIICIIFVLWLLRIERKQAPGVSRALWIPTVWMLVIATKPLSVWFQSGGESIESGSVLDQFFFIAILCFGLLILAKRHFNWFRAMRENIWVMLLIGYMLVSILWSDIPFISFKRWTRELIAIVMAFFVLSEPDPRGALQSIFRRIVYILIPLSWPLIRYFPEYGRIYHHWSGEQMWNGVALHKNSLGRLCAFASLFLVWTLVRRWQGRDSPVVRYQIYLEVFILFLALWLQGGPQHSLMYSATSTVALALSLACFFGLLRMKKLGVLLGANALIVIVALIIVYGTATPFVGGLSLMDVSSELGRDESLTGRTEIWAKLVPLAMRHPLLGHGLGGFWTTKMHEFAIVNEAHNGYLEVVLSLGFVGLGLFAMLLLSCSRKALRAMTRDFDWGAFWICYLLMVVVHNITEASLNSFATHLTAVLVFLSVCISDNRKIEEWNGIIET